MAYPIDPITELAATKAIMHFKAAQCDELRAENEKLRELVRDMWQSCPVYTADCYGCEHHIDGGCKLYDRMHELGVEVDE